MDIKCKLVEDMINGVTYDKAQKTDLPEKLYNFSSNGDGFCSLRFNVFLLFSFSCLSRASLIPPSSSNWSIFLQPIVNGG